jgi:outer membrane protease
MTNVQYLKLSGKYEIDKWVWEAGLVYAKASEVAEKDKPAFNHTTNKTFDADAKQESDYGMELDFNFKYKWNQEIHVDGGVGYLLTGDYYAFNNSANPNVAENSYILQIRASLDF